ncbi:MAG: hypothetical protein GX600_04515 [Dehalococcoidia bacterium]|nr:hypothetical protein [Dehalococcoidia bacterium]
MYRTDWGAIELEYVTSPEGVSYRDLATKHGIDSKTVDRHGKRDGWVAKREAHWGRVGGMVRAEVAEKAAKEQAEALFEPVPAVIRAAKVALDALADASLPFNSKDAAIRVLLEAVKVLQVLGGQPDSVTQQDVSMRPLDAAATRRLKELVYALDDDGDRN